MGATNFKERTIKHDQFVSEVTRDLMKWGYRVSRNGRESGHGEMSINQMNDPGACEIRFRPDLSVQASNKVAFIDPKFSTKIERQPYMAYTEMSKRGIPVYVVAHNSSNEIRFCHISDLVLLRPSHPIWPIVDGWISPRSHPNYTEYKRNYPLTNKPYNGSGTDYKLMDFGRMCPWGPLYFSFDVNAR